MTKAIFQKRNYHPLVVEKYHGVSILTIENIPWVFKDTNILYKIDFAMTLHDPIDISKMNKICRNVFGKNVSGKGEETADWYISDTYHNNDEILFYSLYLTTDAQYTMFLLVCFDFLKK